MYKRETICGVSKEYGSNFQPFYTIREISYVNKKTEQSKFLKLKFQNRNVTFKNQI
jgi:hypothetical protein